MTTKVVCGAAAALKQYLFPGNYSRYNYGSAIGKTDWNYEDIYVVDINTKLILVHQGVSNRYPIEAEVGTIIVNGWQARNIAWGSL